MKIIRSRIDFEFTFVWVILPKWKQFFTCRIHVQPLLERDFICWEVATLHNVSLILSLLKISWHFPLCKNLVIFSLIEFVLLILHFGAEVFCMLLDHCKGLHCSFLCSFPRRPLRATVENGGGSGTAALSSVGVLLFASLVGSRSCVGRDPTVTWSSLGPLTRCVTSWALWPDDKVGSASIRLAVASFSKVLSAFARAVSTTVSTFFSLRHSWLAWRQQRPCLQKCPPSQVA